jgi:filamentous hemagglutinin
MPKLTTKTVGAGGSWKVIDERPDPSVVKQLTPHSCVAAVGEMLLRGRGIVVSQQEIIDILGEPSSIDSVAAYLNSQDTTSRDERWRGLVIERRDLSVVLRDGSFGAVMREGSTLGHLVVVDGIVEDRLKINDPWDGTSYRISILEFFRHWNGEVLLRWKL